MEITETVADGLKREIKVVIPRSELDSRLTSRLEQIKANVRLPGFRPGKVPVAHLRRAYGKAEMAQVVNDLLAENLRKMLADRGERAATQPNYELPEDQAETERILSGQADLAYAMKFEVLPNFEVADVSGVKLERPVASVSDDDVDAEIKTLAETARPFKATDKAAETGDRLQISFLGKIAGEPFEGGAADDYQIRLGSGQFIPGFEEQLVGTRAGERRVVNVTFPADYRATQLAGKAATFEVTVKEVAAPGEIAINDELATQLGVESLGKLRQTVRDQLEQRYRFQSRQKVKRQLLDRLDGMHAFDLPPTMVEQEFANIWKQVADEMAATSKSFADVGTTEEEARADYRKIAERRVRLGLVLSSIGEKQRIEIADEEVQRALTAQMRQFPGQERQIYDYYRNNPDALAGLRAPIFEEKVVDYLLDIAQVAEKPVSKEELMADDVEEGKGA
ncbi:MAG: trigger factor [Bauldia sp.]